MNSLKDHQGDYEAVARRAAELYGQTEWESLGPDVRARWLDGVPSAIVTVERSGEGQTNFEQCLVNAVKEWYANAASAAQAEVAAVEGAAGAGTRSTKKPAKKSAKR